MKLILNFCFFTAGLLVGSLVVNDLSIDLLSKLSLIITAIAAASAGTFNLVKMAQQKRQQRWEIQKTVLLDLARYLVKARATLKCVHTALADKNTLCFTANGEIVSTFQEQCGEYGLYYKEVATRVQELYQVWWDCLPEYLQNSLHNFFISQRELQGQFDKDNDIESYESEEKMLRELQNDVGKACLELSGVLK